MHQKVLKSDNSAKYDIDYYSYDAAGNLLGYTLQNFDGSAYTNWYSISQKRFEGYKEGSVSGTSNVYSPGTTTDYYDVNGNLVAVTDSTYAYNNRSFVNDTAGRVLYASQNGYVQRQLIVSGDVMGRYGEQASGADITDFNFGYQPINGSYPVATPGVYIVSPSDTLQSIARSAYGDSSLWYRIAEANGLSSDRDLKVGQTITIPNRVAALSNNAKTFKPYDPSVIRGDTTPNLPVPPPPAASGGGGCGGLGQILTLVVVVAVAYVTQQYYLANYASATTVATATTAATTVTGSAQVTAALAAGGSYTTGSLVAAAAIGGAAGNIAGQLVGNALGIQQGFSWNSVALSAIGGGIGAGIGVMANGSGALSGLSGNDWGAVAGRAALGNALTQGIGVVTGLQKSFDWRGVAGSAVGAGVGQAVSAPIGDTFGSVFKDSPNAAMFATRLTTGLVAGTAAAVARGGRVAIQQVATDAFGNALGESIAGNMSTPGTQEAALGTTRYVDGDVARSELQFGRGYRNNFASVNALMDSVPSFDDPVAFTADRFEGTDVAGPGGSDIIRKAGASKELLSVTTKIYNGLDDLNAALSMGNQDLRRIQELKASGLRTLGEQRDLIRSSPALMQEMLDRGLTFAKDAEPIGMLGALGNSETVHRIAVATLREGGAGMASAEGITAQLSGLDSFGSSFVNRMPGDMSVERAAPGLYMNTLMGLRSHVDSTAFYVGSLNDQQFAQLGQYADTVIGAGGMSNYKQNEALAGVWTGLQGSPQGYARVGEGMSIVARGLGNVARGLGEALGGMAMGEGALANSTLGKMLFGAAQPMYIVPPGPALKGGANPTVRAAASRGSTLHSDKPGHLPDQLRDLYPETTFDFTKPGVAGQDVRVLRGTHPSQYPGSTWPTNINYADFKPGTPSGARTFASDQRLKWPQPTHMLPYDPKTGLLK